MLSSLLINSLIIIIFYYCAVFIEKKIIQKEFTPFNTLVNSFFYQIFIFTLAGFFIPGKFIILISIALALAGLIRYHAEALFFLISEISKLKYKIILLFSIIAIHGYSAIIPKINDDYFYYYQSIKHFYDSGWLKGISNLYMPLGLGSTWHSISSIWLLFGLESIDSNGLFASIFLIYLFSKKYYLQGFILISLCTLFFISSPNTDIIIALSSLYYLIELKNKKNYYAILALLPSIKLTGLLIWPLFFVFQYKGFQYRIKPFLIMVILGFCLLGKNFYQTGHFLYPYLPYEPITFSWTTPSDICNYYSSGISDWGEQGKSTEVQNSEFSTNDSQKSGFNIRFIINLSFVLAIVISLLNYYINSNNPFHLNKEILFIWALFYLGTWWYLSPQFRFILPLVLIGLFLIQIKWNKEIIILRLGIVGLFLPLLININLIKDEDYSSSHLLNFKALSLKEWILPSPYYSFSRQAWQYENKIYYRNIENNYCGNVTTPCLYPYYSDLMKDFGYTIKFDSENQAYLLLENNNVNEHTIK